MKTCTLCRRPRSMCLAALSIIAGPMALSPTIAQTLPRTGDTVSTPIADVRYDVTFNRDLAQQRRLDVVMSFTVAGNGPVLLSLPAWTPGAYEISNFARWVLDFTATAAGKPLVW